MYFSFLLGVGIGQAVHQGSMARPIKRSAQPNSFNKLVKLELL